MKLHSSYIDEIIKLSKADNISFVQSDEVIKIIAQHKEGISFKHQVIKTLDAVSSNQEEFLINKEVLKLIPKNVEVEITDNIIIAGRRKIKYTPNGCVDKPINDLKHLTTINDLKHLISGSYAIAKDCSRPTLAGLLIDNKKFVACDGFRISIRKYGFKTPEKVIVDGEIIPILKKIKNPGEVNIFYNDKFVNFVIGDTEIIVNRIAGEFFKYESILPNNFSTKVVIEIKPILDILKDFKKNNFRLVKLSFIENTLTISASDKTTSIEESVEVEMEGKPIDIHFNVEYLIDCFSDYEFATLNFTSKVSPMIVDCDYKTDLILPVLAKEVN